MWTSLPIELHQATSLNDFKTKLSHNSFLKLFNFVIVVRLNRYPQQESLAVTLYRRNNPEKRQASADDDEGELTPKSGCPFWREFTFNFIVA